LSSSLLSRRHFLQLAGIALAASRLPALTSAAPSHAPAPPLHATYGRALGSIPVYAAPTLEAPLLQRLWSDTVVPVHDTVNGWYRLPQGYTPRESLQPLVTPAQVSQIAEPPFWGTVSGAVAVVRAYCAADAPVVTRIGHGGVLRMVDWLSGWYGVADDADSALLGWVLASVIAPVTLDDTTPTLTLTLDAAAFRLDVYDGDQHLLTAPVSTGQALTSGDYPFTGRFMTQPQRDSNPCFSLESRCTTPDAVHGIPYALTFGKQLYLTGAYWHNRFGAASPGAAIQVTPPLAQWLYPRAAEIIIS
jgi:hypothetical protein